MAFFYSVFRNRVFHRLCTLESCFITSVGWDELTSEDLLKLENSLYTLYLKALKMRCKRHE